MRPGHGSIAISTARMCVGMGLQQVCCGAWLLNLSSVAPPPRVAMQTAASSLRSRKNDYSLDPCMRTTEWMMEVNEQVGNRVAFYFITDNSHPWLDGCYSMDEPQILALVRRIGARGHEIGLHGSYESYRDAVQFGREVGILQRVMEEEGVLQDEIGAGSTFCAGRRR